jgi:hypothetical protein
VSQCQENAGILFNHACKNQATAQCAWCRKMVCSVHVRVFQTGTACVNCVRHVLKDRNQRSGYVHLREDPYFYWYFDGSDWEDGYNDYDYDIFSKKRQGGYYNQQDRGWEGT